MPLRTKRWNDPVEKEDGLRMLVTRFRPRGLPKNRETWAEWRKQLAPSQKLLAEFHGKHGPPLQWDEYRARYLAEMNVQVKTIHELGERVKAGETITLLCSSDCEDPAYCHRTLLAGLIADAAGLPRDTAQEPPRRKLEASTAVRRSLLDWIG